MSGRPATIRDVAQRALVSPASVSRHLNGHTRLPPDLARRIDEAVLALEYRPNVMARRLSRGTSEMLGFVTADVKHPFFAAIASAAELEASLHGFGLMILNTRNQVSRELDVLDRLDDGQVDGLIFLTNHLDEGQLRTKVNQYSNIVLIDEDVQGTDVPKFFIDNESGGWLATQHLIKAGHRRIAHVGGQRGMVSVEGRLDGYQAAMAAAGLAVDTELLHFGAYDQETGEAALHRLWALRRRPTAIFAGSDVQVLGIYRAARELGLSLPRHLSIVGFDDSPFAEFLNPPLTTIRQPADELGRLGVRALLEPSRCPAGTVQLPVELIARASVAARGARAGAGSLGAALCPAAKTRAGARAKSSQAKV